MDTPTPATTVAEIVTFRLIPGSTAQAFLHAARATEPLLRAQPGFLRRRLTQGADGLWTDWVEWQDLAAAQTAAETVLHAPAFAPFMALIDGPTVTIRHAPIALAMD
jgi:hypothetical protein